MGKRSAGEALLSGTEKEIRRLRFEAPALERAFREEYAEKSRGHLRVVMSLILIAPILRLVVGVLREPADRGSLPFWITHILSVLINLGAVLLTWSPQFPRFFQPYMALICLFMGTTLLVKRLPDPEFGIAPLLVGSLMAYTLFRLRFLTAVLVYWTLLAFFLGYSLWVLHTPTDTLVGRLGAVMGANLVGMLAGYTMEHAARRDFILSHLLEQEREKSERLLLNILPERIAQRLKEKPGSVADSFPEVTILFADIVDFTPLSAHLSAEATVTLLNEVFSCFDALAEKHGLEKIKTIGDAYMVVGGLPEPRTDHAEAVTAMALDMQQEIERFQRDTGEPLGLRIGINTGPVVAGVIGTKKFTYDLWGDTVNIASRMESHGITNAVQMTHATYERVRHRYRFEERRLSNVKGRGEMTTYLLLEGAVRCASGGDTPIRA